MSKVWLVLSFLLVGIMDMVILLAVSSMVIKNVIEIGIDDQPAWFMGIGAAIAAFAHLKFRHKMRRIDRTKPIKIEPIHNEEDHKRAMEQIDRLWDAKPGTSRGDQLEVLVVLVSEWERQYFKDLQETPETVVEDEKHPISFIKFGEEEHHDQCRMRQAASGGGNPYSVLCTCHQQKDFRPWQNKP